MTSSNDILFTALKSYQNLGSPIDIKPVIIGQINKTYLVTTMDRLFIFQELSPIFETTVMDDAWAVASHLEQHELLAPTLLHTDDGTLFVRLNNRVFRALKYIEGKSVKAVTSHKMARSAGVALGKFHLALADFNYEYHSKRRHGGDYLFHKENLQAALNKHAAHDYFSRIEPLAHIMLESIEQLTDGLVTTKRHSHGDPKISNLIFNDDDKALCMVDFDTLGQTGWSLEVADALRSWCNPYPEDVLEAHVDLVIAEHALAGYGSIMRGHFTEQEALELVTHTKAITLCLAMRYAADTLNECYFMHDQNRFSRPAEHNWLKTQAMYGLFVDFSKKSPTLKSLINEFVR
jgi:Ser/Thr protein kinase RdoA (MazF antagonist)